MYRPCEASPQVTTTETLQTIINTRRNHIVSTPGTEMEKISSQPLESFQANPISLSCA